MECLCNAYSVKVNDVLFDSGMSFLQETWKRKRQMRMQNKTNMWMHWLCVCVCVCVCVSHEKLLETRRHITNGTHHEDIMVYCVVLNARILETTILNADIPHVGNSRLHVCTYMSHKKLQKTRRHITLQMGHTMKTPYVLCCAKCTDTWRPPILKAHILHPDNSRSDPKDHNVSIVASKQTHTIKKSTCGQSSFLLCDILMILGLVLKKI